MEEQANPVGRPTKYDPIFNEQVFKLCLLGATDKEIADFLNIRESTLNNWKIEFPEFMESIKKGKGKADSQVAEKLFKRAIGFKFDEVTFERFEKTEIDEFGNVTKEPGTKVKTVRKLVVPDTTAQIFWLKNRQSKNWRDKQEIDNHIDGEMTITRRIISKLDSEKE